MAEARKDCTLNKILVIAAIVGLSLPVCTADAAPKVAKGPNGLSINCADFQRLPDGNWKSGPNATLSYPDRPGSLAGNTFSEHGISINGVDLAAFLDQNCQ